MREDLVNIQDLMKLLGYCDERSIKKWCKTKGIPIIKMGLNKYILQHFLTQYIDNQLVIFDKAFNSIKESSKKLSEKIKVNTTKKYKPENEIVNKYLSKYETDPKSKTTLQRPS